MLVFKQLFAFLKHAVPLQTYKLIVSPMEPTDQITKATNHLRVFEISAVIIASEAPFLYYTYANLEEKN